MISKPLYKQLIKSNWILITVFIAILAMYMSIMTTMYDPQFVDQMQMMMDAMPEGFISAMGYDTIMPGLEGFLGSYFYGMLIVMFPMIFNIVLGNKLIASNVDKGSMSCLLSTPNTRNKISITSALFSVSSITFILIVNTIIGFICSAAMFPGELDIKVYIMLNVGALLLQLMIGSICFFFSSLFNETKRSLLFGAGIPILFFLVQMLANIGGKLEKLKYATLLTLYNPEEIVLGDASTVAICFITMGIISAVLYVSGIIIFNKKDLPV